MTMLTGVWQSLAAAGYEFIESAGGGTGGDVADQDKAPTWLTVDHLVDAFRRMDNPASCDRDKYVGIMQGAAAAMHGIEAHHGTLSPEQKLRIRDAAVDWAVSHKGTKVGTREAEESKWQDDWSKATSGERTSWEKLCEYALELGADFRGYEFTGEPHPTADEIAIKQTAIEERARSYLLTTRVASHDALALEFSDRYGDRLRYVAEWGHWMKRTVACGPSIRTTSRCT